MCVPLSGGVPSSTSERAAEMFRDVRRGGGGGGGGGIRSGDLAGIQSVAAIPGVENLPQLP